jgi:allantoicase
LPGVVRGIVVDTSYFVGNYPPEISVEGCEISAGDRPDESTAWTPLVPRSAVDGDAQNAFSVDVDLRVTHVRLCLYPDGGVARLRVHGEVIPDRFAFALGVLDLAALENGGLVVAASDAFFGSPQNLLSPGPARTMGEGWETRRRRDAGNDWVVVRLAARGVIRLAEIDTTNFLGNAPESAVLSLADLADSPLADPSVESAMEIGAETVGAADWVVLLGRTPLQPDTRHRFLIDDAKPATHVRLDSFPDGGIARLRLWGSVTATS